MNANDISIKSHQYSCELEILMKKVLFIDCPTQSEIRINLYNSIENVCFRLSIEHTKKREMIMSFLNKYSSIGENIDTLIETNGTKYMMNLIKDFEHLLKGCGYNV